MGQSTFSVIQILCIFRFVIICPHLSISETKPKIPNFLSEVALCQSELANCFSAGRISCFVSSVSVASKLLSSCFFKIIFFPEQADYCPVFEEAVRTSADKGC